MRFSIATLWCLSLITCAQSAHAEDPQADNTKQNRGLQHKHTIKADSQDNRRSDIKVLAEVRRHVTFEKGLSMDAKNVKILVKTGVVTLAGPVETEAEKARIEELTKECQGVQKIDNRITVIKK